MKRLDFDNISKIANNLHVYMRDYAKISESEKPLLVSAVIVSLMDEAFRKSYTNYDANNLAEALCMSCERVLKRFGVSSDKIAVISQINSFIKFHEVLSKNRILHEIIEKIDSNIQPLISLYEDYDLLGNFYQEFLKYTGGDKKGLGIVLTPRHITQLFVEIAGTNKNSILLDTCAGTGALLLSGMTEMIRNASSKKEIENIKSNNIIGVEQQPNMYTLCSYNMILRGDGKSNLYLGSCFDDNIIEKVKRCHPNIGIINPPYSQRGDKLSEWHFIHNMLNMLEPNSTGIAIIPMSCLLDKKNEIKRLLLEQHTLDAVMTMPEDLFHPVCMVDTCCVIFKSHVPHPSSYRTWLAIWKNDGFEKRKSKGRIETDNWQSIRKFWIESYLEKKVIPGYSVLQHLDPYDEWCAENYLETDYSELSPQFFYDKTKNYSAALLKIKSNTECQEKLEVDDWPYIKISDLFEIRRGSINNSKNNIPGDTPFISAVKENNGISGYVNAKEIIREGSITVANSGQGGVGFAFYHPYPFVAASTVNILMPKFHINEYIGNFICSIIQNERYRFSFGRGWTLDRMKNFKIRLPVDKNGEIDFEYMEAFVKNL